MHRLPTRTNKTILTNDELLIFDFLFDKFAAIRHLFRRSFSWCHNVPYTHNLTDEGVKASVARLINNGLLQSRVGSRNESVYTLSEEGGHFWELERQPLWDKYCTDITWPTDDSWDYWMLSVKAVSHDVCRAYFEYIVATGRCQIATSPSFSMNHNLQLIPWKSFPVVYELRVPLESIEPIPFSERSKNLQLQNWWNHVSELEIVRSQE